MELKENPVPEKIFEHSGYGAQIYRIRAKGTNIYFQCGTFKDGEGNDFSADLYQYDILKKTVGKITDSVTKGFVITDKNIYFNQNDALYKISIANKKKTK